jgi:hypothetical protein
MYLLCPELLNREAIIERLTCRLDREVFIGIAAAKDLPIYGDDSDP